MRVIVAWGNNLISSVNGIEEMEGIIKGVCHRNKQEFERNGKSIQERKRFSVQMIRCGIMYG